MKSILNYLFVLLSLNSFAQKKTSIITERKNTLLQAVLNLQSIHVLYAGQEYIFSTTTSHEHAVELKVENARVQFIENSLKTTGGLQYSVTPIDTGSCTIQIGNRIDKKTSVSLYAQTFKVINYPVPPIQLIGSSTGQIISNLRDSTKIECSYDPQTGIFDKYEILSWNAKIGDKIFSGKDNQLSKEFIEYVNHVKNEFLHLEVILDQNKTGHLKSKGIYLISKD